MLEAVCHADAPAWLRELPAVQVLRIVVLQNYLVTGTSSGREVRRREADKDGLLPARLRLGSPYDTDAFRLYHLPARLTKHARRRWLRIDNSWPWAGAFTTGCLPGFGSCGLILGTGLGTCLAKTFSTTGSKAVHRLETAAWETAAWETPDNSAAASWTRFCRSRNSTSTTSLYRPSAHIRRGVSAQAPGAPARPAHQADRCPALS
ncbi:hypothetical protein [Streptomyces sp. NPDC001774]